MRWLVVLLIACGGSKAPPPTPKGPPASLTATAARGDVQVATVNGRPVWGSCVAAQAARGATAQAALDQCIGFELMAQEAEARGLATDREVVLATHTALVSQLVALDYEDRFQRPEDFGAYWDRSVARNKYRFDHSEVRGSVYVRIDLDRKASADDDAHAKQLIDEIYAALKDERGLMKPHVEDIATRVIGTRAKLSIAAVPPDVRHGQLDDTYAGTLFAIPEVGRVSPPVRTHWGWDVILWESVIPEVHTPPEQVIEQALPEVKRGFFPQWVNRIATELGVHIEVIEKNLALLENL